MSNSKCVYYKEKEQKSIDGGITWVDTGNFRKGALISTQASQCGSFVTEYRWTKADYVCDNANKYKGYKQQVSHDNGGSWVDTGVVDIGELIESNSKDCGYDEQWFTLTGDKDFICDGAAKYKKKEMKYTRDSGTTWNSFDTPRYEKGDLIAQTSTDCATPAMKVTYTDGTSKTFYNLTSIEADTVGNTVGNRGTVKEVEIYDGVTSIGDEAFDGYYKLTSIKIPNSVTSIGNEAFHQCLSLTDITIPDGVKRIGNYAFSDCTGLNNVTIGNGVTNIGEGAFASCSGLTKVTIPGGVTNIGNYAFNKCTGLTSITIPDSVKTIGYHAFYSCSSLRTMTVNATTPPTLGNGAIPTTIQRIYVPADSVDAYKSADEWKNYADKIWAIGYDEKWFVLTGDKDFICEEGSKYKKKEMKYTRNSGTTWNSFNPPKYEKGDLIESNSKDCPILSMKVTYTDGTEKKFYGLSSIEENTDANKSNAKKVEIYSGVTSIGFDAFGDCSHLTDIAIANSVTSISNCAFINCSALTNIIIPKNVAKIKGQTFQNCSSLRDITIPDSVTSIEYDAFNGCTSLTDIIIHRPSGIGERAFYGCSKLKTVTVEATTPPKLGYSAFTNISSDAILYVPNDDYIVLHYEFNSNWATAFNGRICPIGLNPANISMTVMFNEGTSRLFTGLTTINKNTIGRRSFNGEEQSKTNAKSAEIYDGVIAINKSAFEDTNLISAVIGKNVKTIGEFAFANGKFKTITVEATTPPSLGSWAFSNTNIETIYVPTSSVNSYKSATNWKDYADKIQAIPE